ncbi:MAG: ABC transporter permease [Candidatus Acidiferrales bacterium]
MSLRNIGVVYHKEMIDSLRDRRTVISMTVVPLLLFPALTLGMGLLGATLMSRAKGEVPLVMVVGGEDSPRVVEALKQNKKIQVVPGSTDFEDQVSNKLVRAAIILPLGFDAAAEHGDAQTVSVDYYEGDIKSELAMDTAETSLKDYRVALAKQLVSERGVPGNLVEPFKVEKTNVAPPEKVAGSTLGGLIPYFVIILSLTGAMYPAMDLTAGEKERGTMETILTSPVSRSDLVLGKFFMVLTASLATALLSLTSMAVSFFLARNLIDKLVSEDNPTVHYAIDPRGILAVLLMVLPLSVLFAATLLAIALFAKSFREAQTYLSPLTVIVIMPAVAALLPGVELNTRTALIPILSTTLVGKELMAGNHPWGFIMLIFLSSCVYASLAIAAAVTMFNRESVLFRA